MLCFLKEIPPKNTNHVVPNLNEFLLQNIDDILKNAENQTTLEITDLHYMDKTHLYIYQNIFFWGPLNTESLTDLYCNEMKASQ